jgi:hypothetical protein
MGSADLHGLAVRGENLIPSRCTSSNVHNDLILSTKFRKQICDWYLEKPVFCIYFKNSNLLLWQKDSKKGQRIAASLFTPFSSSVTLKGAQRVCVSTRA